MCKLQATLRDAEAELSLSCGEPEDFATMISRNPNIGPTIQAQWNGL